jgi:TonB family protein
MTPIKTNINTQKPARLMIIMAIIGIVCAIAIVVYFMATAEKAEKSEYNNWVEKLPPEYFAKIEKHDDSSNNSLARVTQGELRGWVRTDYRHIEKLRGGRNPATVHKAVSMYKSTLNRMYSKHLREKPGTSGEITVKFTIDEFGKVISLQKLKSTMNDSEFENTVLSIMKEWDFFRVGIPGDITEIIFVFLYSSA